MPAGQHHQLLRGKRPLVCGRLDVGGNHRLGGLSNNQERFRDGPGDPRARLVHPEAVVINRVVPDDELRCEAESFRPQDGRRPHRAHVVHKALLHAWATGGIPAADHYLFDLAVPLFETEEVKNGLVSAARTPKGGRSGP